MRCGQCGAQNREDAQFCSFCGAPATSNCSSCGRELVPDAMFCDRCGTPVSDENAPHASQPPRESDAVRKDVTVLFCDLVGSTSFAEQVDAESVREVLAEYHATAREVIEAHGGTVAKFIGDGVMATYGLPEVSVDDAERAVRTGLALQDRVAPIFERVAARHRVDLGLRVGVNSGEVAVGDADDDLVGDVLNTAARLEAECEPGSVLVGGSTWRLTRSTVVYEAVGAVEVRGKAEPVSAHRVVRAGGAAETAAPFVGRDEQLAVLEDALATTVEHRRATLVTIVGDPGVGKTRLAAEFVARHGEVLAFDLRCERTGSTFDPVAELVRAVAGLSQQRSNDEVMGDIAGLLGTPGDERDRIARLLASFVGSAPAPTTEEAFFAVRRLCELLSRDRAVVLVIDDIQWAEPLMLDLVEHLGEWVQGPLLVVNLARPELRDVRSSLAEPGRRLHDVVFLQGLDGEATRRLAAELLGTALPAELADRLPASTDGNPLFVRELVRMLIDDGVITEGSHGWQLAVDVDAIEVPPTIQSLLSSRVERLPDEERHFVELAAIAGSEFPLGAVVELSHRDRADLAGTVERLRRKDVIEPTGAYRGDEPILRFHHVLIRDAAYRRILKKRRAELHEQLGNWTEATASSLSGEHDAAIAHHFEAAHRYRCDLGLDDGGLGQRAAGLLHAAAVRALGRDDLSAVAGYVTRALAVVDDSFDARGDLLLLGCEAMLGTGDVGGVAPLLDELAEADDERLRAWATCFRGQLITFTDPSQLSATEIELAAAADDLHELGDSAGVAKARQVRAGVLARLGRVADCEAELDRSLSAGREADDRRRISAVLGAAPTAALWGPSPVAQAGGRCLDVVRLVRITNGSPAVEATSWRCQAVLEALRGRFDTARTLLADSRAASEELGLRHGLMETELYAGIVELLADEPEAAEPHLRTANEGLERAGIASDLGQATAHLARALLAQGRLDEAEELAVESAALAGQNPQTAVVASCARAEILAARGQTAEAVVLATEAVERLQDSDIIVDLAAAYATLARAHAAAGDAAGAQRAKAEADRLHAEKGASVHVDIDGPAAATASRTEPVEPGPTGAGPAPNRAAAVEGRLHEALLRRDAEALARLAAPDVIVIDDRAMVTSEYRGLEEWLGWGGSLHLDTMTDEFIAVRGDRLVMTHVSWTRHDFSGAMIAVGEIGDDGRYVRRHLFDEADLARAVDTLEQWAIEGELAEYDETIGLIAVRLRRATESGDGSAIEALVTDDFELVDHRSTLSLPVTDGVSFSRVVAIIRQTLGPFVMLPVEHLAWHAAGLVSRCVAVTAEDGYQLPGIWLQIHHGGRVTRIEAFDADDEDAALARFEELTGAESSASVRENAAWRTFDAVNAAIDRGDIDATMAELDHEGNRASRVNRHLATLLKRRDVDEVMAAFAPDAVFLDRRASPVAGRSDREGLRRVIESLQVGSTWDPRVQATRGERLTLDQVTIHLPQDFDLSFSQVVEIDDDSLITRVVIADPEQEDELRQLLDEWWLEGEGAPTDDLASRASARFSDALDRRDLTALAATLSPGVVFRVHRRLSQVSLRGRDAAVDRLSADVELLGVQHSKVELLASDGDRRRLERVSARLDTRFTVDFLTVLETDADGLIIALDLFDEEDLDQAQGLLYRSRTAEPGRVRRNTARRSVEAFVAAMNDVDVDAALKAGAETAVMTDNRRTVADPEARTWETTIRSLLAPARRRETAPWVWEHTGLAVRGDRWTLGRFRADIGGNVKGWVGVTEIDETGRITRGESFDIDDVEAAQALLNEWWLADRPPAEGEAFRRVQQLTRANLRRDASDMEHRLTDDFRLVDRRRLIGVGGYDRDGLLDVMRSSLDERSLNTDTPRLTARGLVCREMAFYRRDDLAGPTADRAWLILLSGDRIDHIEIFDGIDIDVAVSRFDHLTS